MLKVASVFQPHEANNFWAQPVWHWWWSPSLRHYRSVLYDWMPQVNHGDIDDWSPDGAGHFPEIHFFLVTPYDYENLPDIPPETPAGIIVFMDFQRSLLHRQMHPTWFIPWHAEQGLQHPRFIRLVREIDAGLMEVNRYPEYEPIPSPFADWLADIQGRILATQGTVILSEISSLPFISTIVAKSIQDEAQSLGQSWEVMGPFEAKDTLKGGIHEWLRHGHHKRNQLILLYGEESPLKQLYEKPRPSNIYWFWLPRLSQLTHTWNGLIPYLPRTFKYPFLWTRWAWRKLTLHNWPDDIGSLLRSWERLACLACTSSTIVTAQQVQLMVSGYLPAEVPEPLSSLVTNLLHELMREGKTEQLMNQVIEMFEKTMLEETIQTCRSLNEATRFLGISRATIIKKLERFQIANPWQRSKTPSEKVKGSKPLSS